MLINLIKKVVTGEMIVTKTCGQTKNSETEIRTSTPFVCVEDIIGKRVDMNYVIYNPFLKDKGRVRQMLFDKVLEVFGYALSEYELNYLCKFDSYQTTDFSKELAGILPSKKIITT